MRIFLFLLCICFISCSEEAVTDFINLQNSKAAGKTAVQTVESSTRSLFNLTEMVIDLNQFILYPNNKTSALEGYTLSSNAGVWTLTKGTEQFIVNTFNQILSNNSSKWSITNNRHETLFVQHSDDKWHLTSDKYRLNNGYDCMALDIVISELVFVEDVIQDASMIGECNFENENDSVKFALRIASAITISMLKFVGGVLNIVFDDNNIFKNIARMLSTTLHPDNYFETTIDGQDYTIGY